MNLRAVLSCSYIILAISLAGVVLCSYIHLQIIFNTDRELIILNFVFSNRREPSGKTLKPSLTVANHNVITSKRFLYLVQSESCLPDYLIEERQLGGGEDRDVLVLNWREICAEHRKKSLSHLVYIFDNKTSWGSGRNILYRLARQRNHGYLYFIFLDEDIEFSFTPELPTAVYKYSNHSPLRAFESFLKEYQPAVGLTHFCSRCGKLLSNGSYIETLCCSTRSRSGQLPPLLPVSIGFDAAFNAFHANAVDHLLPYKLNYEDLSWWDSQKYVILKADILFRGQVVRYNGVTALNNKHRDYPRKILDNWMDILQQLRMNTPSRYYNESVFHLDPLVDMVPELRGKQMYTPRFNITIPCANTSIIPYDHFDEKRYNEEPSM